MPLNITRLAANRAPLTVDFGGGETLDLVYYPDRLTAQTLLAINADDTASLDVIADLLLSILASWDVVMTDDNGADVPYPLTKENLLAFSLRGLRLILQAISQDASGASVGKSAAPTAKS